MSAARAPMAGEKNPGFQCFVAIYGSRHAMLSNIGTEFHGT
jgi:hypothetical protein